MKLREQMPELTGATEWLNGQVTRGQLVGERPTLFHFWSISCHLCKKDMPQINQFRDHFKGQLHVVAVHMPRSEQDLNMEEIKQVAAEHDLTQPIFIDNELILTAAFENQYVPAYYLFDKEGKLRHYQVGSSGKMLEKRVNRVIDEMKKE